MYAGHFNTWKMHHNRQHHNKVWKKDNSQNKNNNSFVVSPVHRIRELKKKEKLKRTKTPIVNEKKKEVKNTRRHRHSGWNRHNRHLQQLIFNGKPIHNKRHMSGHDFFREHQKKFDHIMKEFNDIASKNPKHNFMPMKSFDLIFNTNMDKTKPLPAPQKKYINEVKAYEKSKTLNKVNQNASVSKPQTPKKFNYAIHSENTPSNIPTHNKMLHFPQRTHLKPTPKPSFVKKDSKPQNMKKDETVEAIKKSSFMMIGYCFFMVFISWLVMKIINRRVVIRLRKVLDAENKQIYLKKGYKWEVSNDLSTFILKSLVSNENREIFSKEAEAKEYNDLDLHTQTINSTQEIHNNVTQQPPISYRPNVQIAPMEYQIQPVYQNNNPVPLFYQQNNNYERVGNRY